MCVDRQQIISVIYAGNATLANQSVIGPFGIDWQSPDDQKLQFNCDRGQRHARSAWLQEGRQRHPRRAGHHRQVRAACAPDAVPDHGAEQPRLQRQPRVLDRRGRLRRSRDEGDPAGRRRLRAARSRSSTDNNCSAAKGTGYDTFDIALWDWFSYTDPDFQLSVATRASGARGTTPGYDNPVVQRTCTSRQAYWPGMPSARRWWQKMDKLHLRPVHLHVPREREGHLGGQPKLGRVPPRAERLQLRLHDGALPEVDGSAERGAERKRNEWKDEPTMW